MKSKCSRHDWYTETKCWVCGKYKPTNKQGDKVKKQISSAWTYQSYWLELENDCKHKLEVAYHGLSGGDLTFQCKKCKWYFHYVHRLEPYFQQDKQLDKKKQTSAKLK